VTIGPFDAWVLNRLLASDQPWPREEFGEMSEFWLEVAYSLLVLAPSVRQAKWDQWLARQDDGHEIRAMMAKVPPDQPAPPVDATEWPPSEPYRLRCAESIPAKPVEWLWSGRVPLGMLTLFAGDPKLGKSYVALALADAVSRGSPLPDSGPLDLEASYEETCRVLRLP
jgi:AAA domain